MVNLRTLGGVVLGASVVAAGMVSARGMGQHFPDRPGQWEYRAISEPGKEFGLSVEQNRTFTAKVNSIASIVRETSVFNPPLGFQARARADYFTVDCLYHPCAGQPARAALSVILYYFVEANGKVAWGGEANTSFEMRLNDPPHFFGRRYSLWYEGLRLSDGREICFEPHETGRVAGAPVYDGNLIVIATRGRPAWVPVTRGDYLTALIALRQEDLRKAEAGVAKLQARDAYDQWLADRPKRLEAAEAMYQQLKKTDPAKAEQMRVKMEQMEAEIGARLKASRLAPAGPDKALEYLRTATTALQRERARMTPAERDSPAWLRRSSDLGSGLAPARDPAARPLVAVNPGVLDRARPATDIQLVTVLFAFGGFSESHIGYRRLLEAQKGIDWKRIAALVE
jgi:hypothetical protein